jgi:hypothetical protein
VLGNGVHGRLSVHAHLLPDEAHKIRAGHRAC